MNDHPAAGMLKQPGCILDYEGGNGL